mmetsp:Transcript_16730/g.28787  ORF Transcript_16730/g.28787 Transcript_16730/m.28787 type:complete len:286 (-) Transcript_16730:982-1839(-)
MPVLSSRTRFGVHSIGTIRGGHWNVIADITDGMTLCHIAMRVGGTLSRTYNVDAWESLIPIDDGLGFALLELMSICVEDTLGQCLGVQQWYDVGGDKGIKALVELATLAAVAEGGHESRLVLLERMAHVNLGKIFDAQGFRKDTAQGEGFDIIKKGSFAAQRWIGNAIGAANVKRETGGGGHATAGAFVRFVGHHDLIESVEDALPSFFSSQPCHGKERLHCIPQRSTRIEVHVANAIIMMIVLRYGHLVQFFGNDIFKLDHRRQCLGILFLFRRAIQCRLTRQQ